MINKFSSMQSVVLAIGLSLVLWTIQSSDVAAQNRQVCQQRAAQVIAAIRQARAKRCNVRTAPGFNTYFNICMRRGIAAVNNQLNQWARYARSCRPAAGQGGQGGQGKAQFCRSRVAATMAAVRAARNKRCRVPAAANAQAFQRSCLANSQTVTNNSMRQWQNYARTCRPVGGQGGQGKAQFCRGRVAATMAAVRAARNKRCRVPATANAQAFQRSCLANSQTVTNNSMRQWQNYARTCRPVGGQGGQGKAQFCRGRVATTMAAVRSAKAKGCRVPTNATAQAFRRSCLANNQAVTNNSVRQWQNFARTCRRAGGQGKAQFCQSRVATTMAAVRSAKAKGCRVPTNATAQAFRRSCLANNQAVTNNSVRQWQNFARTCRAVGGQNKAQFCQGRVAATMAAVRSARTKGCRVGANATQQAFQRSCLANTQAVTNRSLNQWQTYARTCRRAGGQGNAQFCRGRVAATMAAVRSARTKGCRVGANATQQAFQRSCLANTQAVTNNSVNQWRNFARTCRPTGGQSNARFCQGRVASFMTAVRSARTKGCRVGANATQQAFQRSCLANSRAATNSNLLRWRNFARTCRPVGVRGNAQFCQRRAQATMVAVQTARAKRCRVGPSATFQAFRNSCLRITRAATNNNVRQWQNYARTCRPVGGQGAGTSAQFCRTTAIQTRTSINQARNKGCNVRTSRSFSWYFQNCRVSPRQISLQIRNAWSRYARTCRRGQVQCPAIFQPVCARVGGVRRTFPNSCVARRAGARAMLAGRCASIGGPSIGGPNAGGQNFGGQNFGGPRGSGPGVGVPNPGGPRPGGPNVSGPNTGGPTVVKPNRGGPTVVGPRGAGPTTKGRTVFTEEFKDATLGQIWEVLRPNTDAYLVEDGFLTILSGSSQSAVTDDTIPNLMRLIQQLPSGNWQATIKFTPEFQTGKEVVFFGLHDDKDFSMLAYFEQNLRQGKCIVTLSAGRYLSGKLTDISKEVERKEGCVSAGANALGIPQIVKRKPVELRLSKVGRAYIVSAKLSDSSTAKFVILNQLTLLRAKGRLAFGIYLKDAAKGEGVLKVDWVKIETID